MERQKSRSAQLRKDFLRIEGEYIVYKDGSRVKKSDLEDNNEGNFNGTKLEK